MRCCASLLASQYLLLQRCDFVIFLCDMHEDALVLDHIGGAACAGAMNFLRLLENFTVAAHGHAFLLIWDRWCSLASGPNISLHGILYLIGLLSLPKCSDGNVSPSSGPQFSLQDHRTGQADVFVIVDFLRLVQHCCLNLEPVVPVLIAGVALRATGVGAADSLLNDAVFSVDSLVAANQHGVGRAEFGGFVMLLRVLMLRAGWLY